jgi:peptidyl-prolyl cis-trans isomerase SurA
MCFVFTTNAQDSNEVLFELDEDSFMVGPFVDSFQKNSDLVASTKDDLEDYLQLYINFRLKIKSAYDQELDTLQSFQKEFNTYYKQIADSYISNGKVTEAMVKEAYDRSRTEVRASHILLNLSKYDEDTAKVYNKALMLMKRAENGDDFGMLAKQNSEDPSARLNEGNLNWFNAFKMVYEFEDAAYKLDVGEISKPVKSDFGYHIIMKTGERASKGKLKTAHILIVKKDSIQDPKEQIEKIYLKVENGDDFHDLAKQYSDDTSTAAEGGYVPAFGIGGLNSKTYENEAFRMENIGDYTKPFQTKFGWHIVKLIEVEPIQSYQDLKEDLKKRLKSSSRSKLLVSKIKDDLEARYEVTINEAARSYFLKALDSTFNKMKWRFLPSENMPKTYVIKIEEREVDFKTFGEYLERQQRNLSKLPEHKIVIEDALNDLVYNELLAYHKTQLVKIDQNFANRIEEYKNGILIFDFMLTNVWDPISKDTLLQRDYYASNQDEFVTDLKIEGQLYSSSSKSSIKEVRSRLKKKKSQDSISILLPDDVMLEQVLISKSSSKIPKAFKFKEGVSLIYKHLDQYLVMNAIEVKPSFIPEFNNVSGKIISNLQEKREEQLISNLRDQYPIKINKSVLGKVKQKFEK